jgi:2-oxoglutarate ferredoxin oxidoreductase subunit delta
MKKQVPTERFWRTPFDTEDLVRLRGKVEIQEERCKGCAYCVEFCPQGCLTLSDRYNLKGYHPPFVSAAEKCFACHLCELLCPEFAIGIEEINLGRRTDEDRASRAS